MVSVERHSVRHKHPLRHKHSVRHKHPFGPDRSTELAIVTPIGSVVMENGENAWVLPRFSPCLGQCTALPYSSSHRLLVSTSARNRLTAARIAGVLGAASMARKSDSTALIRIRIRTFRSSGSVGHAFVSRSARHATHSGLFVFAFSTS